MCRWFSTLLRCVWLRRRQIWTMAMALRTLPLGQSAHGCHPSVLCWTAVLLDDIPWMIWMHFSNCSTVRLCIFTVIDAWSEVSEARKHIIRCEYRLDWVFFGHQGIPGRCWTYVFMHQGKQWEDRNASTAQSVRTKCCVGCDYAMWWHPVSSSFLFDDEIAPDCSCQGVYDLQLLSP